MENHVRNIEVGNHNSRTSIQTFKQKVWFQNNWYSFSQYLIEDVIV